jgi:hypothetical protein
MKLINVTGDMFETGSSYPTKDIEFNPTPALDLADAKTTRWLSTDSYNFYHSPVMHSRITSKRAAAGIE